MYSSADVAIIVPTKDRPQKIRNFLDSLVSQTQYCKRIIIIDGGNSIEDVVKNYSNRLPVEYYACNPPGQIRQRNMAISKLDGRTSLVATFDDDIVLFPNALEKMLFFWNEKCPVETAGVSFNIVNCEPEKHHFLKGLIGLTGPEPGKVLKSGRNTPILNIRSDIQTQWLCGGATVWKQSILIANTYAVKDAKWAISEDLIFSYPIGKRYPMFVCADAKVNHEHVYDHKIKRKYRYYGRTETLWRFNFVASNVELSLGQFYWNQFATIIGRFLLGVVKFNKRHFEFGIGQMEGVSRSIFSLIKKIPADQLLHEKSN